MFRHTCVVWLSWHHHSFAGELPSELGNLVSLTELCLQYNGFQGELYVPYCIRNLAVHITEFLCVCTVTKEEKTALREALPGCEITY